MGHGVTRWAFWCLVFAGALLAHGALCAFAWWQRVPVVPEVCLFLAGVSGGALVAEWRARPWR